MNSVLWLLYIAILGYKKTTSLSKLYLPIVVDKSDFTNCSVENDRSAVAEDT